MMKYYWRPASVRLGPMTRSRKSAPPMSRCWSISGSTRNAAPAYRAVNLKGRAPALVTGGGIITECAAILGFLAQTYPGFARLCTARPTACTLSDLYLFVFARWLEREGAGGSARFPMTVGFRNRMNARPAVLRTLAAEGIPVI